MERDALLAMLHEGVCNISFQKVNGERRDMRGTLKVDLIPAPKDVDTNKELNSGKVKDINPNIVVVYDLVKNDWRSFRIENLVSITPET